MGAYVANEFDAPARRPWSLGAAPLAQTLTLTLTLALAVASCGKQSEPTATGAVAMPPYPTSTLAAEVVSAERRVDGRIEAVNQGTVSAQTSGEVTAIVRDVSESVAAGGVVLRLRAVQQRAGLDQADAALRAARSQAAEAEARYQRIADMYARKVVAKATFDEVTAYRDGAVARLDAANAARNAAREGLGYTEVRMPFAGVVTDRFVRVGETVAPGTPLFAAAALSEMRVIVDVSQDLALQIQSKPSAAVYLGDRRVDAVKVTLYPRAAADSGAFRVRIDLPRDGAEMLPGMFVKVGFITGEETRLLVPRTAIVERGEVTGLYVFEDSGAGRTVFRQVRLGHIRGDRVEILAGVSAGESIAIDPQLALRAIVATDRAAQ
jgi:RND family efflux transporter MFP subunit